jgi:tetratricopeptide (TPR) repeat protein
MPGSADADRLQVLLTCQRAKLLTTSQYFLILFILFDLFILQPLNKCSVLKAMRKTIYTLLFTFIFSAGFAQSAKEFYNSANLKLDKGQYKDAIKDYDNSINLDKTFAEAWYNRAVAKNSIKDYKGAIADYTEAIKLNPNNIHAYNNRGLIKKTMKDYDGATEDYTKAIEIDSSFAPAWFNRGNINVLKEQPQLGCEDFRKALDLGQNKALEYVAKYCK